MSADINGIFLFYKKLILIYGKLSSKVKSLLVVRHAKSSWEWDDINDFERPLNERGKRDAPQMARRLTVSGAIPDLLVASPAKRAKRTAVLFARELGMPEEDILYKTELYHAPAEVFHEILQRIDERFSSIALFSHNPGITAFVNELTQVKVDHMPTCGIYAVKIQAERWSDFREAEKAFWFFDYPKAG
jgi:phosphohistidine phosphatase